ncbi:MAG: hypothetical protein ACLPXB_04565, partial [Thiobacillaceae bacterium]
ESVALRTTQVLPRSSVVPLMPLPVVAMPVLPPATDRRVTRYRVPDESRPNTEQAVPVIKRSILIRGMTPAVSPRLTIGTH